MTQTIRVVVFDFITPILDQHQYAIVAPLLSGLTPTYIALKRVINLQDTMRNTALHYATQLWTQEVVRHVLELGANIGMRNEYDEVCN